MIEHDVTLFKNAQLAYEKNLERIYRNKSLTAPGDNEKAEAITDTIGAFMPQLPEDETRYNDFIIHLAAACKAPLDTEIIKDAIAANDLRNQMVKENSAAESRKHYLQAALARLETLNQEGIDPAADNDTLTKAKEFLAKASRGYGAAHLDTASRFDFGSNTGGYKMRFWNNLPIPTPGATVVGARTGGGKTTALVNITRELIMQGKTVCFISYEMNAQEIYLALCLSIAASLKHETAKAKEYVPMSFHMVQPQADDILTDFFNNLKHYIVTHKGTETLPAEFRAADELLLDRLNNMPAMLKIIDSAGDVEQLADFIQGSTYDAFVIDYVQAIPTPPGAPSQGYQRIGYIAGILRELVNVGKKSIIMGAQFNRVKQDDQGKNNPNHFDPDLEQFREAADIEQLATMAIGSGYMIDNDGEQYSYWKILKHRFNGAARDACMLSLEKKDPGFRDYYLRPIDDWKRPAEWKNTVKTHVAKVQKTTESGAGGNTTGNTGGIIKSMVNKGDK